MYGGNTERIRLKDKRDYTIRFQDSLENLLESKRLDIGIKNLFSNTHRAFKNDYYETFI
jgi:hypothetical protein